MEMGPKEKHVEKDMGRRMGENRSCWDLESEDLSLNVDSPLY